MKKIIFLDIDGVMIPNFKEWEEQEFDEWCIYILLYIIQKTWADIVISSSWRHHLWKLKTLWEKSGLNWELVKWATPSRTWGGRDWEIRQWLDWNIDNLEPPYSWVAIDDEYQPMPTTDLMWKLVRTDPKVWLTRKEAELIIYKLNN